MKSNEVLKEAIQNVGTKSVAHDMSLSTSLLYKWQGSEFHKGSTANPMDRVVDLYKLTGDCNIIQWICNNAGGFFVENIHTYGVHSEALFKATQKILKEFSEMLGAITESKLDGIISGSEAKSIRKEWEDMKSVTESFVKACENGNYKIEK